MFHNRSYSLFSLMGIFLKHLRLIPNILTLFRVGFFGAAHGWGGEGEQKGPLSLKCVTHILQ